MQMGGGAATPPNPPAVLSRVQACSTASESFLKPTMHNKNLFGTPPDTMRAVCLQAGGLRPTPPRLCKLAWQHVSFF